MPSHWSVPSADLPFTRPRSVGTTRPCPAPLVPRTAAGTAEAARAGRPEAAPAGRPGSSKASSSTVTLPIARFQGIFSSLMRYLLVASGHGDVRKQGQAGRGVPDHEGVRSWGDRPPAGLLVPPGEGAPVDGEGDDPGLAWPERHPLEALELLGRLAG